MPRAGAYITTTQIIEWHNETQADYDKLSRTKRKQETKVNYFTKNMTEKVKIYLAGNRKILDNSIFAAATVNMHLETIRVEYKDSDSGVEFGFRPIEIQRIPIARLGSSRSIVNSGGLVASVNTPSAPVEKPGTRKTSVLEYVHRVNDDLHYVCLSDINLTSMVREESRRRCLGQLMQTMQTLYEESFPPGCLSVKHGYERLTDLVATYTGVDNMRLNPREKDAFEKQIKPLVKLDFASSWEL